MKSISIFYKKIYKKSDLPEIYTILPLYYGITLITIDKEDTNTLNRCLLRYIPNWFKQQFYLNLCVLVIPSTIVSHANGPFLRFNESASFPFFKVILSSFDVAFLGKGEHLVVCANSKCANHFNLWWGKIWLRS